jgi:hypothetical protein
MLIDIGAPIIVYFILHSLVLQCHFDLSCGQMGSSAECLHYPRPEPFFAPFAVPTMYRTVGPKLLLW